MKKLKVLMLGLVCVFALTGQTDLAPSPVALRTQLGAVGGYLEDDGSTSLHCLFDGATSMPDCGKRNVKHRGVGPFSASNYFKLDPNGNGNDPLDGNEFTGCITIRTPSSFTAAEVPWSNGLDSTAGWYLSISNTGLVQIIYSVPADRAPASPTLTPNTVNTLCFGRAGVTGYLKVNAGSTSSINTSGYLAPTSTIATIGKYSVGSYPFTGQILEVQYLTTPWDEAVVTAIETAAMNCTTPGRCFPDDPNEVIHLDGDDYNGGAWNGNPDRSTHGGVGTFRGADLLSLGSGPDVLDHAGDFTQCYVFDPGLLTNSPIVFSNGESSVGGYFVQMSGSSTTLNVSRTGAGCTAVTTAPKIGQKNLLCVGRAGNNIYAKMTGGTTGTVDCGAVPIVPGTAYPARLGRYIFSSGVFSLGGTISEFWASSTPWNESNVAAIQAAAMARVGDGPALSQAATDPNTVLFTVGDDFTGASIKSRVNTGSPTDWTVNGVLKSKRERYSWPATTFTIVGDVRWTDTRLNWPSLSFTMNGTVPKVASSSSYPKGFGMEHGGLGGWSASNYLQAGAGSDALDTAGDFTVCFIGRPQDSSQQVPIGDGGFNTEGWYGYFAPATSVFSFATAASGATTILPTTNAAAIGVDNVVCVGRGGTTMYNMLNGGPLATGGGAKQVAGTASPLRLGLYNGGTLPFNGVLREVYFTTTTPSAALLTSLTNQALSCTTPGKCFQPDANAVMHCDFDGDWSNNTLRCGINKGNDPWTTNGALTQTRARYQWPAGATMADREGAGPYSIGNYFSTTAGLFDLGTTGSQTIEMVVTPLSTPPAAAAGLFGNKNSAGPTVGLDGYATSTGVSCRAADGAGFVSSGYNSKLVVGAPNYIACVFSRSGGSMTAKAGMLGQIATGTATVGSVTSANPMKIGREVYNNAATDYFPGIVSEFHVINRALSDSEITARATKFSAQQGTYGEPITVVNTAPATCEVDGVIYPVPANTLCHQNGARAYRGGTTNLALYSEQFDSPNWGGTVVCTPDNLIAPDGTLTADTCIVPGAGASQSRIATFTATAARHTDSIWVRAGGATSMGFGIYQGGFVPQTGRILSGPGAVTGTTLLAVTGLSTTQWTHIATTTDGNLSAAGASVNFYPGSSGTQVVTDSIGAWGHQVEAQPFATSYCGPTLNATKTCNADAVTVPNPFFQPGGLDLSFDRFGNE